MSSPTTPFSIQHTPHLPELFAELGCSLGVTTYQAGKLMLLSSDGERLVQLPRTFEEPMGLAVEGDRMAVGTKHGVVLLANEPRLAPEDRCHLNGLALVRGEPRFGTASPTKMETARRINASALAAQPPEKAEQRRARAQQEPLGWLGEVAGVEGPVLHARHEIGVAIEGVRGARPLYEDRGRSDVPKRSSGNPRHCRGIATRPCSCRSRRSS